MSEKKLNRIEAINKEFLGNRFIKQYEVLNYLGLKQMEVKAMNLILNYQMSNKHCNMFLESFAERIGSTLESTRKTLQSLAKKGLIESKNISNWTPLGFKGSRTEHVVLLDNLEALIRSTAVMNYRVDDTDDIQPEEEPEVDTTPEPEVDTPNITPAGEQNEPEPTHKDIEPTYESSPRELEDNYTLNFDQFFGPDPTIEYSLGGGRWFSVNNIDREIEGLQRYAPEITEQMIIDACKGKPVDTGELKFRFIQAVEA